MAPDLCLIAKTIEWLNSTSIMTVKIKPKVSLRALVSMDSMPDTKSLNKVMVPRISEYTITTDIIKTIIPKIICSNHSYNVRPLACLRNTSSRNTQPPFWPNTGERILIQADSVPCDGAKSHHDGDGE